MRTLSLLAAALLVSACGADDSEPPEIDAGAVERAVDTDLEAKPATLVNLNTATDDEFKTIPGVGDRMAHEFDEYRPYASIMEFRAEIGKYVDEAQVAEYEQYVFVPVDPEESDAETLRQLPGIGAAEAVRLVEGRPYADADAFLATYAELTGLEADQARPFLAE